jgi:phosphate starvation-inducible PhoH-like protein
LNNDTIDYLEFLDNTHLPALVGSADKNILRLEKRLGVSIAMRGNKLAIVGPPKEAEMARLCLEKLYELVKLGQEIDVPDVDAAIKMLSNTVQISEGGTKDKGGYDVSISTKRRIVFPRTPNQALYIKAMQSHDMVFGLGPAGTGKTYLAVAQGVSMLLEGSIDRIILSRPAVEAGEKLGFLPGDMKEKVDPYLRPLYDALNDMLPADQVLKRLSNGEIEVAPLAFMRGRTLSNAFVILDEAQNTTPVQMKMFLTRLGQNSRMVINGDLTQVDLPQGVTSGLRDALAVLKKVKDIGFIEFTDEDVVRHGLVSKIVLAYNKRDKKENSSV